MDEAARIVIIDIMRTEIFLEDDPRSFILVNIIYQIIREEEISAPENKPPFRYDVFDPEGRYLTRVPLNGEPQAFRDGKIYLLTQDEAG
jgi:hypothetical protein